MTPQLVQFKTHIREHDHSSLRQLVLNVLKSDIQNYLCVKTVTHLCYLVEQAGFFFFGEGQKFRVRIKFQ